MLKTFALIATIYTVDGPVIYVVDDGISGGACIDRVEAGLTGQDVLAVRDGSITPAGESHIPSGPVDVSGAVLSCELSWGSL